MTDVQQSHTKELIRLEGVEKHYGSTRVLGVESLSIYEGDRVLLRGDNGSGKSTLLRLAAGIIQPDEGLVWRADELRKQRLGYVPQAGGLYEDLTVRNNLHLRRRLYGLRAVDPASLPYIGRLGLTPFLDKRFIELSGGYQRLAAVAAAFAVDPGWLLLDEPFGGVDEHGCSALLDQLYRREADLAAMIITDPSGETVLHTSRVIEMSNGRLG